MVKWHLCSENVLFHCPQPHSTLYKPAPNTHPSPGTFTFWPQLILLPPPSLISCPAAPDSLQLQPPYFLFLLKMSLTSVIRSPLPYLSLPFPQPKEEVLLCVTIALRLYFWVQLFFVIYRFVSSIGLRAFQGRNLLSLIHLHTPTPQHLAKCSLQVLKVVFEGRIFMEAIVVF